MIRNVQGQALTELAISLVAFLILFFALDFGCSLAMAQNRAQSYLHFLLFRDYRQSEELQVGEAPHPDPQHLWLQEEKEHFDGRLWWQWQHAKSILRMKLIAHFPIQAKTISHLEPKEHFISAKIFRDPWDEHPIRYAILAAATAYTLAQNLSGNGSLQSFSMENFSTDNLDFGQLMNEDFLKNLSEDWINLVKEKVELL